MQVCVSNSHFSRPFAFYNVIRSGSTIWLAMGTGTCRVVPIFQKGSVIHFNVQISSFGGDPSKVTIWGESAGAGAVLQHIVAHGGQTEPQLFRGAMMSSPFLPSQYHFDDEIPEVKTISSADMSMY